MARFAVMLKPRALAPGDRLAVVAPASPFDRDEFDQGIDEIRRLGFEPVYDDSVFARQRYVAGSAGAAGRGDSSAPGAIRRSPASDRRARRLRQRAAAAAARSRRGARAPQAVHRLQRSHRAPHLPDHRLRAGRVSRPDAGRPAGPRRRRATTAPRSERALCRPEPMGELAPAALETVRRGRSGRACCSAAR